jgi:hypothetical protein
VREPVSEQHAGSDRDEREPDPHCDPSPAASLRRSDIDRPRSGNGCHELVVGRAAAEMITRSLYLAARVTDPSVAPIVPRLVERTAP